jgi:ribosome-binding factor A
VTSRRQLKAAEAIREVVSMAILTELQDPRVGDVTVVGVEVTPDLREAKVRISVLGDERKKELTLHGLRNAAGFLQSRIADRIETRYIPKLRFEIDKGLEKSLAVGEILDQIRREREELSAAKQPPHPETPPPDISADDDSPSAP